MAHVLRDVVESDLDAFYEHQREPEATEMALFPARDREAFDAHWQRLLADDSLIKKTIVDDGQVAGNIGCWEQDGRRLIGYWISGIVFYLGYIWIFIDKRKRGWFDLIAGTVVIKAPADLLS